MAELNNSNLDALAMCQMFADEHFDIDEKYKDTVSREHKKQKLTNEYACSSSYISCITDNDDIGDDESLTIFTSLETISNKINPTIGLLYAHIDSETRSEYLLRVPFIMNSSINSYNLKKLKSVMDDAFVDDCVTTLGNLTLDRNILTLNGRQSLYDHFVAVLNNAPDFHYVMHSKPKYYGRCITFINISYATIGNQTGLSTDKTSHLWNPFAAIPVEKMDDQMRELKLIYDHLLSRNVLIRLVGIYLCTHKLNKELTHIESRNIRCISIHLTESKK